MVEWTSSFGFSDVFLMLRLGLWHSEGKMVKVILITVKATFYPQDFFDYLNLDHLHKVGRFFFHCTVTLPPVLCSEEAGHLPGDVIS